MTAALTALCTCAVCTLSRYAISPDYEEEEKALCEMYDFPNNDLMNRHQGGARRHGSGYRQVTLTVHDGRNTVTDYAVRRGTAFGIMEKKAQGARVIGLAKYPGIRSAELEEALASIRITTLAPQVPAAPRPATVTSTSDAPSTCAQLAQLQALQQHVEQLEKELARATELALQSSGSSTSVQAQGCAGFWQGLRKWVCCVDSASTPPNLPASKSGASRHNSRVAPE